MKRQNGFTLVELMITLAVLTILITLAVPSFRTTIQNNRITAQTNELVTALNLARSEAVKRGQTITVCASNTGTGCSGTWNTGWLVMTDSNGDATVNGTDSVLRVWEGLTGNTSVTASASNLSFDRLGALIGGNPITLNLAIPDCAGNQKRNITVNNTGRVDTVRANCP